MQGEWEYKRGVKVSEEGFDNLIRQGFELVAVVPAAQTVAWSKDVTDGPRVAS